MCNLLGRRIWKGTVNPTATTANTKHTVDGHLVLKFRSADFAVEVCKLVEDRLFLCHYTGGLFLSKYNVSGSQKRVHSWLPDNNVIG